MGYYDFTKQPSLLIQGAMDTETAYFIEHLEEHECVTIGNWKFHTGFLGAKREPVIISKTFQGMVNAAAATSLALAYFKPWAGINLGIGGGHDKKFHRGDIVLGEKVVPMGAIAYAFSEEGAGIDGKSFSLLPVEIFYRETGKTKKVTEYPCDGKLLKAAEQVKTKYHTGRGVIGSGDEWNNQLDRIALLRERYHTAVEDMEAAAAAQLCLSYGVPFLGVRILSNSIVNGEKFDEAVGIDGQKFMLSLVDQMREYM